MFIELTIEEAVKRIVKRLKVKEVIPAYGDVMFDLNDWKLCYVERVAETIYDWPPEAKHFWETNPEYLAWKKRDNERRDWELKTYGHSQFQFSPWDDEFHMVEIPNPALEKGTYVAYFTPIPLEKQWGDDWNDAPYEHNAGEPYDDIVYGKDENGKHFIEDRRDFPIYKVYFTPKHEYIRMPEDYGWGGNSPFCVDDINKGAVAWMFNGERAINAGIGITEFAEIIADGF